MAGNRNTVTALPAEQWRLLLALLLPLLPLLPLLVLLVGVMGVMEAVVGVEVS